MDTADFAQKNNEIYLDAALKTQLAKRPADVEAGEIEPGICIDCEGLISRARMAANPQAVRCIDCQTKQERREKNGHIHSS
ncbi:MAG: TraR/DksA C4-type zinc finger protein [Smithellaceae bacterium]